MDHVASLRAARLLVLQTEDHAAPNNDGLQGKATELHKGGDSTSSRAHFGIKETCAGPFQAAQGYRYQVAAAEWGPWWRQPLLHLAEGAKAREPPGYPAASHAVQPCPRHVPVAAPRMRALTRANYRVPGLRVVHQRLGQARTRVSASPAAGFGPNLMFPCPKSWSLQHCSCLAELVRPG